MEEKKSEDVNRICGVLVGMVGLVVACVVNTIICEEVANPYLPTVVCFGIVPCAIAMVFGAKRNRFLFGFLLGFLFGWMGVIVVSCFKPREA